MITRVAAPSWLGYDLVAVSSLFLVLVWAVIVTIGVQ